MPPRSPPLAEGSAGGGGAEASPPEEEGPGRARNCWPTPAVSRWPWASPVEDRRGSSVAGKNKGSVLDRIGPPPDWPRPLEALRAELPLAELLRCSLGMMTLRFPEACDESRPLEAGEPPDTPPPPPRISGALGVPSPPDPAPNTGPSSRVR